MRPEPFARCPPPVLARIAILASDIDDTLTVDGELTIPVLGILHLLVTRGVRVVLVTGRPAGMLLGLIQYLPGILHGIAENGGVMVGRQGVTPLADEGPRELSGRIRACEQEILSSVDGARSTADRFARVTDATFELTGLSPGAVASIREIAGRHGLGCMASSIHVHVHPPRVSKGAGLMALMERLGVTPSMDRVLTVGDSETDASLFDPARFPLSVGVANTPMDRLPHLPAYITSGRAGEGFLEVGRGLLEALGPARGSVRP